MAWEAYITSNLMCPVDSEGNTLDSAAILGLDGSSVWASSAAFQALNDEEARKFVAAFDDVSIASVMLAGAKYLKTSADGTIFRGRKDKSGFVARKGAQCIIIGFYTDPPVSAQTCNKVVEALADYLADQGY
ncbi:hypothetical protein CHLRE_10g427250v5 [Chlamydomonas reinhardtii]|uniref:Profilin n=1 Tax=Chlamydomonas reinhardtii TaxID=3055 RepID=Q94KS3_CHLRE|nr:uncharacterized protein CHLRE_10g427250v5 [Chlamydomonas reinhardtii]AAK54060.1 profilin [Chlamydomonas reinhardtii]PNW77219.1 hypothetical protein CHLRE_10g427250v5 [Chlamydomonas reinhardtii]|eukprot:XP_001702719.1 profilin [Chlamydomonas reinhardtii]